MAIFSATQPSLRVRVLPRFPANVVAGAGMTITKNGGTYTFSSIPVDLPLSGLVDIPTDTVLGRDTSGTGPVEVISVSGGLGMSGGLVLQLTNNQRIRSIPFTITGAPITTGIKGDIEVPFACVITGVTLLADQNVGATPFQLDIWKTNFAGFPALTNAASITASNKPIIPTGQLKVQNTTLTGWNVNINAGDILRFNVDTTSTVTRVQIAVDVTTV